MTLGYNQPLYILPFDHRGSFQTGMFGWEGALSPEQTVQIAAAKRVIYDGLKEAVAAGVPKEHAGILVDEQFGAAILRDAARSGYVTCAPAEKSGQEEFDFEYGEDFAEHIEACNPTFCKVLVRYNPEGDTRLNQRQAARLRRLSDYLHAHERKYMFELLVPATPGQLNQVGGDRQRYDHERRPALMVNAIRELQEAASSRTSGRSKDWTAARIACGWPRPLVAMDADRWAASSSAGVRTSGMSTPGSRRPPACQVSSALR
jgi:tagatose-1,6-bisphosphate aldolase